jgi:hypothetical protein
MLGMERRFKIMSRSFDEQDCMYGDKGEKRWCLECFTYLWQGNVRNLLGFLLNIMDYLSWKSSSLQSLAILIPLRIFWKIQELNRSRCK